MLLRQESKDGLSVLSVTGSVREQDTRSLLGAVAFALQEQPRGVVVDLVAATVMAPGAVLALDRIARLGASWPSSTVVFAATSPAVVSALPAGLVHPDAGAAARHLAHEAGVGHEQVQLGHTLEGPAQARAAVLAWSERLGFDDVRDDVTLVVSEMVTNAVRHAAPPVALELRAEAGRVLICVHDGTPEPPERRPAPSDAEGGRGLLLVDLICEAHGVRSHPPGKTVWAAVSRPHQSVAHSDGVPGPVPDPDGVSRGEQAP